MTEFQPSTTPELPSARTLLPSLQRARLFGLVVILGSGFGLQYAMARMMGLEQVSPLGALFTIHLALSVLFLAGLGFTRRLFRPNLFMVVFFLVVSIYGNLGQLGVELLAAHHIPAGELTLIVSLLPVFVLLLVCVTRAEPVTPRKVAGILTGTAAATAILLPQALVAEAEVFWVAVAFLAPMSQAVGTVLMVKYWPRGLDPLQVATGNLVAGTILLLPFIIESGEAIGFDAHWDKGDAAMIVFAATVAAEFYIFALLTRQGGAVLASCADFIAVCAGLGFGFVLFAEVPSLWMLGSAVLCLLALRFATHG